MSCRNCKRCSLKNIWSGLELHRSSKSSRNTVCERLVQNIQQQNGIFRCYCSWNVPCNMPHLSIRSNTFSIFKSNQLNFPIYRSDKRPFIAVVMSPLRSNFPNMNSNWCSRNHNHFVADNVPFVKERSKFLLTFRTERWPYSWPSPLVLCFLLRERAHLAPTLPVPVGESGN